MLVTIVCNDSAYFLRHRRTVADALISRGTKVNVLLGGDPLPAGVERSWGYQHVGIERFSFAPLGDLGLVVKSLVEFLRNRPVAVQLITLKPAVFSGIAAVVARMLTRSPMRIVITIPGLGRFISAGSEMTGARNGFSRALVKGVVRWLSNRKDVHFVFETRADRAEWLAGGLVKEQNSEQIAGAGVNGALYYPAARSDRKELRVLFASRLLKSKGLDVYLDVARDFHRDRRVRFMVAGMIEPSDPDGVSPSQLAQDPAIEFLGAVSDMPALLRTVDVVCLPTRYGEGIPRILIEAAASGLPSIASDLDGCRQIVLDGVNGAIVPSAPDLARTAVAAVVERYLERPNLVRDQGAAGRRHFLEGGFSEVEVTGRYLELLGFPEPPAAAQT